MNFKHLVDRFKLENPSCWAGLVGNAVKEKKPAIRSQKPANIETPKDLTLEIFKLVEGVFFNLHYSFSSRARTHYWKYL